jgi:hypothetical protein
LLVCCVEGRVAGRWCVVWEDVWLVAGVLCGRTCGWLLVCCVEGRVAGRWCVVWEDVWLVAGVLCGRTCGWLLVCCVEGRVAGCWCVVWKDVWLVALISHLTVSSRAPPSPHRTCPPSSLSLLLSLCLLCAYFMLAVVCAVLSCRVTGQHVGAFAVGQRHRHRRVPRASRQGQVSCV